MLPNGNRPSLEKDPPKKNFFLFEGYTDDKIFISYSDQDVFKKSILSYINMLLSIHEYKKIIDYVEQKIPKYFSKYPGYKIFLIKMQFFDMINTNKSIEELNNFYNENLLPLIKKYNTDDSNIININTEFDYKYFIENPQIFKDNGYQGIVDSASKGFEFLFETNLKNILNPYYKASCNNNNSAMNNRKYIRAQIKLNNIENEIMIKLIYKNNRKDNNSSINSNNKSTSVNNSKNINMIGEHHNLNMHRKEVEENVFDEYNNSLEEYNNNNESKLLFPNEGPFQPFISFVEESCNNCNNNNNNNCCYDNNELYNSNSINNSNNNYCYNYESFDNVKSISFTNENNNNNSNSNNYLFSGKKSRRSFKNNNNNNSTNNYSNYNRDSINNSKSNNINLNNNNESRKKKIKEFHFREIKRENVDKKIIRKFKKFLKGENHNVKNPELIHYLNNSEFWSDFINKKLMPPFHYEKEKKTFKSFNTLYLQWFFEHKFAKELYDIFLNYRFSSLILMLKDCYFLSEGNEDLTLLKVYVKTLPEIYGENKNSNNNENGANEDIDIEEEDNSNEEDDKENTKSIEVNNNNSRNDGGGGFDFLEFQKKIKNDTEKRELENNIEKKKMLLLGINNNNCNNENLYINSQNKKNDNENVFNNNFNILGNSNNDIHTDTFNDQFIENGIHIFNIPPLSLYEEEDEK